jgi:hypothetical protein
MLPKTVILLGGKLKLQLVSKEGPGPGGSGFLFVLPPNTTNFENSSSFKRNADSRYISLREHPNQPNSRVSHLRFNRSNQRRPRFDLPLQMNS